ncbi:SAM-dependent methyltransferase [Gayadomonas joobiniege]|uniref:SAM-dependent methyltransferase n=1 Tax=Gayadomonas joobiniege TaxID=1234606 RepID=UPI000685AA89|nr:cyclopropane-fatty-acyl-phospholipid synthase family protein [Gayadomonas joobiniege]
MAEAQIGSRLSQASLWQKYCRSQILDRLVELPSGFLKVKEAGEVFYFGDESQDLHAEIIINDISFYSRIILGGSLGAGEAYMEGLWSSPDLTKAVQLFAKNQALCDQIDSGLARFSGPLRRIGHWFNRNTKINAKRNISAHYDLGNDFYQLFLDPSLMYSAAVYPTQDASLAEASQYKLALICQKLDLKAEHHLIEIGTGWGAMAIYAAKHYGCKVTTTTLSQRQYEYACAQVKKAGLTQQVSVLKQDYRDLTGQYDRLVSIEMIEAVGAEYYSDYFSKCSSLLKDDGRMLLQAITIKDQRYDYYLNNVDFIQKYIFPGGALPSLQVMMAQTAGHTDMLVSEVTDIGLHYADTLADWRTAFVSQIEAVRKLGFEQRFIRMWLFYLAYCEGGFRERVISTVHFVADKPLYRATVE